MDSPSSPQTTVPLDPLQVLAGVIRDQQAWMERVLGMVLNPTPAPEPVAVDSGYYSRPQSLDREGIDDSDPMEVFLGADFLRSDSDLYDPTSDSPFGLPGIKDESPALDGS